MKFIEVKKGQHSIALDSVTEFEALENGRTRLYTSSSKFTIDMSYDSFKKMADMSSSLERDVKTIAKSAQYVSA